MFQPPLFREDRIDVMQDLMRAHPFATVVTSATGGLTADHVPLVLHDDQGALGVLRGHFAAGNPLFRHGGDTAEVLAVFQGPQSYVTPSWYPSKREHGKVVPTWNYAVVHARGTLRFVREANWLLQHLKDLTDQQESHREAPWHVSDAPDDYIARQLKGLVGFEIAIHDITGKWKVSQNKATADSDGVRDGLLQEGSPDKAAMSRLVEERARR